MTGWSTENIFQSWKKTIQLAQNSYQLAQNLSPILHKHFPFSPTIAMGKQAKWFTVTCDTNSVRFGLQFTTKILNRDNLSTNYTVSSFLLHSNRMVLLIQPPCIHIGKRPAWQTPRPLTNTLSLQQVTNNLESVWKTVCFTFLNIVNKFSKQTSRP